MFARLIAFKYLFSRKQENFINLVSIFAVISVALGVAVLNTAMSIMNGFEHELQKKLIGEAHVQVRSFQGKVTDYPQIIKQIEGRPDVEKVRPFIESQVLLSNSRLSSGFLLKALGDGSIFPEVNAKDGTQGLPRIAITQSLSEKFALFLGDKVQLISPEVTSSPFGLVPRQATFQVAGILSKQGTAFDDNYLYTDISDASRFLNYQNAVSGVEVSLTKPELAAELKNWLKANLQVGEQRLYAQDWTDLYPGIWEAISLEKKAYFVVLLLLIVLASFSIVTCLIMIVLEKQKDIAIIRTIGATAGTVRKIFTIMGTLIGFTGTILGLILGYLACIFLQNFGFKLPENVFPTNTLPILINYQLFLVVGVLAFVICLVATLYPAHRASRLKPSDLLRYQ